MTILSLRSMPCAKAGRYQLHDGSYSFHWESTNCWPFDFRLITGLTLDWWPGFNPGHHACFMKLSVSLVVRCINGTSYRIAAKELDQQAYFLAITVFAFTGELARLISGCPAVSILGLPFNPRAGNGFHSRNGDKPRKPRSR